MRPGNEHNIRLGFTASMPKWNFSIHPDVITETLSSSANARPEIHEHSRIENIPCNNHSDKQSCNL